MSVEANFRKVTTKSLQLLKKQDIRISALTAYDFITAKILDEAGIDIILVGDSLSNVFQGNETTLPVTMDEMIYHTKAVAKGAKRAMIIVDMPFMSYQGNSDEAFTNAGRIMKETPAGAVKMEGGIRIAPKVERITEAGIPVMGHIGLTPQSIHQFGSYKARGKDKDEAKQIIADAEALEKAGAFAVVLEKIPKNLAKEITGILSIPTIGIGAGMHCDGQILVTNDMLGLTTDFSPRFVRRYAELSEVIKNSVENYVSDIRAGNFPTDEESY
ncbi:MAG: 3-methyl-2-oxobutanoate hydroxymethyltransferase [Ignavibacteriales bacterium]|nr:3-methyl-2-oxobutanoate hydroxymethyltransferase [Ignavibacteriales bacterium]MCF8314863.1 3-methyl-2-oxobutanoate hydroxymethyltransferase [Ignavibacteriales bacterium]MCF8436188.1 3-methyl-2-oxobutanoate hydroxymethyltransferase [Ignavibacteriales bacterium]